jgi:chromosome segregation ATPase
LCAAVASELEQLKAHHKQVLQQTQQLEQTLNEREEQLEQVQQAAAVCEAELIQCRAEIERMQPMCTLVERCACAEPLLYA